MTGGGPDSDRPRVLLTRAPGRSRALADRMAALGFAPLVWPLLEIERTGTADLSGAQAALFTSANALAAAPAAPLPALCVGDATAAAATRAGFADVRSAAGDATALAALARATLSPDDGPLVFIRGEDVAGDAAGALRAAGFTVREQIVYRARQATEAPQEVAAALAEGRVRAAAFFSPRAAAAFAALAAPWRGGLSQTAAAAISASAAAPLEQCGFARIHVAERPDGAAVAAALEAAATRP